MGCNGGFSLFWVNDLELPVQYASSSFVVVEMFASMKPFNSYWLCFAYIPLYYKYKQKTWEDLFSLFINIDRPSLIEDLNDTTHPFERVGGVPMYYNLQWSKLFNQLHEFYWNFRFR